MKLFLFSLIVALNLGACSDADTEAQERSQAETPEGDAFRLTSTRVVHLSDLDLLVFEQTVTGQAGSETPTAIGGLAGAPVWGHVFLTTLEPEDVGFSGIEEPSATVALAVTSHPDFDDTPLWDEDRDRDFDNDGVRFHPHWVVLVEDEDSAGGLSVLSTNAGDLSVLPPTNPGMPMYMDSPGFSVRLEDNTLRVLVPVQRLWTKPEFNFDAVTAKMTVDTSGELPILRVSEVLDVASGDLSLPYAVELSSDGL